VAPRRAVAVRLEGMKKSSKNRLVGVSPQGNENHELGASFFKDKRIISAVKWAEFVSDRMSYMVIRGHWCHIIVLNVHAPIEDKTDDMKDSFYEEVEHMLDKLPKYHMKILLGDFNDKVSREEIFKPTIGNESLHKIGNDNTVRLVNFVHLKTSQSKVGLTILW
jgi:exonuclease III